MLSRLISWINGFCPEKECTGTPVNPFKSFMAENRMFGLPAVCRDVEFWGSAIKCYDVSFYRAWGPFEKDQRVAWLTYDPVMMKIATPDILINVGVYWK